MLLDPNRARGTSHNKKNILASTIKIENAEIAEEDKLAIGKASYLINNHVYQSCNNRSK